MKVREVITLAGWQNGSGWTYQDCYEDHIIDIDSIPKSADWDWWDTDGDEPNEDGDVKITIEYFAADYDKPLATFSVWQNDLIAANHAE